MEDAPATNDETLFPSRTAAREFLVGIALFWGFFAVMVLLLPTGSAQHRPPAWLMLPLAAVMAAGFALAIRGQVAMQKQRTGRGTVMTLTFRTQVDALRPQTLRRAGEEAGFDGTVVATALYLLLGLATAGLMLKFAGV